jgi:sugar/nucleoside kinase (ribokinase family)
MSEGYSAVVAGHICLDVIPQWPGSLKGAFEVNFQPGRLLQVGPISFSCGGPVSNTGLAMNKLGVKTLLMGKVGADSFGQTIRQAIGGYDPRLAEGMIVDPATDTSYTIIINPPGVDRIFLHSPGANDTFKAADVRYDLVAQTRLFHFGYPPIMALMFANEGAELAETLRQAKSTGATTSVDMALPDPASPAGQADWRRILQAALPYVDIFLPSGEEIVYMLHRQTYDHLRQTAPNGDILPLLTPALLSQVSQELLTMGVKMVGIKLGYRGIYLRTAGQSALAQIGRAQPANLSAWANRELWAPACRVNEVGATGAGDAAIAGFLSSLLHGLSLAETLTFATAVGACNVEAADSLSGIRSWAETRQRLANGWPRRELALDAPGWVFEASGQLWQKE